MGIEYYRGVVIIYCMLSFSNLRLLKNSAVNVGIVLLRSTNTKIIYYSKLYFSLNNKHVIIM